MKILNFFRGHKIKKISFMVQNDFLITVTLLKYPETFSRYVKARQDGNSSMVIMGVAMIL